MAIKQIVYRDTTFRLSYEVRHRHADGDLLILHGWGSHKELMAGVFGDGLKRWRHIYLDLPGFGKSDNPLVFDTDDYAEIVRIFLESIGSKPDAVIGHSFGGKVAVTLAPPALVLLSSAGIVMPKPFSVRAKIALFKALKPIGGSRLRRLLASKDAADMPQNMYETFKKVVDEDFSDRFAGYEGRALVCWGREDTATPLAAGRRIAKLIPRAEFEVFEGDHYFFLTNKNAVVSRVEAFLETV